MTHISPPRATQESGSILLVALVILVALSFIGGLALTTTNYELHLSRNDKVITRLKTRTAAVALATAQRLESLPDNVLDNTDWVSEDRPNWLSRGENDKFDAFAFDSSVVDEEGNPLLDENGDPLNKQAFILAYTQNIDNWGERNRATFTPGGAALEDEDIGEMFNDSFGNNCQFQVIDVGTIGELGTGNNTSTMHKYYISGYCVDGQQTRLVQLGYKKKH